MNKSGVTRRNHWIFDLDGTLTVPCHDFPEIKRQLGIPQEQDILSHFSELPAQDLDRKQRRLHRIEIELAEQAQPHDGAPELIAELAARGVVLGIVTRNAKACARVALERIGLSQYFAPGRVLAREQARPKPDPDGINKLLRAWRADADDALMVGDYYYDLAAARAAGVAAVHLDTDGLFPWPEQTDLAVTGLRQLLGYLNAEQ